MKEQIGIEQKREKKKERAGKGRSWRRRGCWRWPPKGPKGYRGSVSPMIEQQRESEREQKEKEEKIAERLLDGVNAACSSTGMK